MNLQLENRTALVTGSTAGIGLAIADALAAEGARVVVNGRTPERVEAAVAELSRRHSPARVSGVAADLTTGELSLARGLAETTANTAVTVNSILPGPTRSEGVLRYLAAVLPGDGGVAAESAFLKKTRPTSLLGRFAEAEEVASVAAFLCSPLASAINGAAVRAEGGLVRSVV